MTIDIIDCEKIRKLLFLGPKGSYSNFAKDIFINYFDLNLAMNFLEKYYHMLLIFASVIFIFFAIARKSAKNNHTFDCKSS